MTSNIINQTIKITLDAKGNDEMIFNHVIGKDSMEDLQETVKWFYSESHVWIIPNLVIRMTEVAKSGGKSEIAVPIQGFNESDLIWIELV